MGQDTVRETVALPTDRPTSFALFTSGFARWWPAEFSWSGADDLIGIGIEGRQDGALYEIGPHGLRWDWGRVLEWDPPHGLVFSWQIGPDRVPVPRADRATEVAVSFAQHESGTLVEVLHRHWERHGERGAAYRQDFDHAWPTALEALRRAAENR